MKQTQEKNSSPIRVKDFFTNPLHKIRQSAFVDVGFNNNALSTFIRTFVNKHNTKYLNAVAIKNYIQKMTNGNPKLMSTYQDFFNSNFQIKDNLIEIDHFMEFFLKEEKYELSEISEKTLKLLYTDLKPLNADSIASKCQEINLPFSKNQAQKMVKVINFVNKSGAQTQISEDLFINIIKKQ